MRKNSRSTSRTASLSSAASSADAGPPADVGALQPGDAVAVRFNSPRGGVKPYGGKVVRVMARMVRISFRDVAGSSSTYDVKAERVLTVAA